MNENPAMPDNLKLGTGDARADDLIIQIMTANAESSYKLSRSVDENYQHQIARLQAQIWLIRHEITTLCSHPWVPQTSSILDGLYPTYEDIDQVVADMKVDS